MTSITIIGNKMANEYKYFERNFNETVGIEFKSERKFLMNIEFYLQ